MKYVVVHTGQLSTSATSPLHQIPRGIQKSPLKAQASVGRPMHTSIYSHPSQRLVLSVSRGSILQKGATARLYRAIEFHESIEPTPIQCYNGCILLPAWQIIDAGESTSVNDLYLYIYMWAVPFWLVDFRLFTKLCCRQLARDFFLYTRSIGLGAAAAASYRQWACFFFFQAVHLYIQTGLV